MPSGPISRSVNYVLYRVATAGSSSQGGKEPQMIILGIVLVVVGLLVKSLSVLITIGIILLVVGAILWVLGSMGRAVGGRKHYF
jgi:membrane-bound ClpP family serine protease